MTSSLRTQLLNESSSLTNAQPRRQILESLRSRAPSEELRERRRRCFIASSFSKHSPDKRLVLDESKSKRFTLAMREDEEIDFFESLWNSLAARRAGNDAATRPTLVEGPVAMEPCNVQADSATSKQTSAELGRCGDIETRSVDVYVNSGLRRQQHLPLDDGHALITQQSISSLIEEGAMVNAQDMNVEKVQNTHIDASINDSNGLKKDSGRTGKSAIEQKGLPEIGAKKINVHYHSDSNAFRNCSSKQNCNFSDCVQSCCGENANVGISSVPKLSLEPQLIAYDESPHGCVITQNLPTPKSVLSQTDQCNEENLFPKRTFNTLAYIDDVNKRNVYTQTSPKLHYGVRNNRGLSCSQMEAKGTPNRNWYRNSEHMNERTGDQNVRPHRRSHSCHIEQPRRFHYPKAPYAGQRYRTERGKKLTQNIYRRSNLRYSRHQQVHSPHVDGEMANVGCKYSSNQYSSYSSVSNASTREECSCSSNHETSCRRPYEKKARNYISKIHVPPRRSFSVEKPFGRTSTRCGSEDAITSHGGDVFAPPRHILLCSTCDVVVNSKKKMWAHLKGARHSRRRKHGEGEADNPNRVVCCSTKHHSNNMLTCRMSIIEPPTLVPVLLYALVEKHV